MAKKHFYIKESELDDFEIKVLYRRSDRSFIVKGCAGSGKSILALHKVKQIQEEKLGTYYFILFTKTLKQFMQDVIKTIGLNMERVTYYWHWKNKLGAPAADYIIVDEAQDFTESEINLLKSKAKKALILYGDSAQQMYRFRIPSPLSMEEIATLTKFPLEQLVFNYRLPKKIARLAEKIGKIDDDLVERCKIEGSELPKVLKYDNKNDQYMAIIEIIKNKQFEDVGIFFRNNNDVKDAEKFFKENGLNVEVKYDIDHDFQLESKMTLDFNSSKPKLMTFHSCKGTQFEIVFIPNCNFDTEEDRILLYVGMTRAYESLFILYSDKLSPFFKDVPQELYETTLITKTSRRL